MPGHSNGVTALAFSPDTSLLASGGRRFDQAVKIWAVTNGGLLTSLTGHVDNIEAVAFAPDGDWLVSGSSGLNNLRVWKRSDGSVRNFGSGANPVFAVGFSPDGTTLVSAERDTIKFWSTATGALSETATYKRFAFPVWHTPPTAICCSSAGRMQRSCSLRMRLARLANRR